MGEAIRTCLAKYFTFSGRASRAEYWWFFLFLVIASFVVGVAEALIFGADPGGTEPAILSTLWQLATLVPSISAGWRRMHDTGRSGVYLLYPVLVMVGIAMFAGAMMSMGALDPAGAANGAVGMLALFALAVSGLVFLISPLLVLWWLTRPSEPEPNRYGPPPAR